LINEEITTTDIVLKYTGRWDIEISIREIKTLMDINVGRSKMPEMLQKELDGSLTAYNMVRKIIAYSTDKADFFPQEDIFQKCTQISRPILLDKKGRVFHRWSAGRYGKTAQANKETPYPPLETKNDIIPEKIKKGNTGNMYRVPLKTPYEFILLGYSLI
jgi:hypothetical protein